MATKLPLRSLLRRAQPFRLNATLNLTPRTLRPLTATPTTLSHSRAFTPSTYRSAGIMPETDSPAPKDSEPTHHIRDPTPVSDEEYLSLIHI